VEQADFAAKIKAREDKTARTGKKPRGKPPAPPSAAVRPTDQINLTDEDSRRLPATGMGFEQSYNARAAVDPESLLIVATGMALVATDKQQVAPMLEVLAGLPEALGRVEQLLADNGYFSASNVACRRVSSRRWPRGARHITRTGRTDSASRHRWPSLPARWSA
jgi:hypothetical protein